MSDHPSTPDGRISNEFIICPWCGHDNPGDWGNESTKNHCEKCNKYFILEVEENVVFRTRRPR